jgi:Spy/CpxP family protein refolding chaperone
MRRIHLGVMLAVSLSANVVIAGFALRRVTAPAATTTPPLFAKVSLDDDQKARIGTLRERLLAERAEESSRLADLRGALAHQLARDPEDARSLDAILTRIEEAQRGFQRRVVAHVVAVRAVLRPDQRPAFEELVTAQMRGGTPFDPSRGPAEGATR